MPLTAKQRELMDYLARYVQDHGYSPKYEEIAARFGYRSLSTVHEHLRNLAARGVLRLEGGRPRSIEILRLDDRVRLHASVFPPTSWLQDRCDSYPACPHPGAGSGGLAAIRAYRERWNTLRAEVVPGDELWTFQSPPASWADGGGRAGYAIVRAGRVIEGVVVYDQLDSGCCAAVTPYVEAVG